MISKRYDLGNGTSGRNVLRGVLIESNGSSGMVHLSDVHFVETFEGVELMPLPPKNRVEEGGVG